MTHELYQEQISLYVDNKLRDRESSQLFAHLAGCDECRVFLKSTMFIHRHIADKELEEVPRSLDRRVLSSVMKNAFQAKPKAWYAPMWFTRISIPLPAAASILFLLIVGSLLFSPIITQDPPRRTEIPVPLASQIPASLQKQLQLNK